MKRIDHLVHLGEKIQSDPVLHKLAETAEQQNPWMVKPFVEFALASIREKMLQPEPLQHFTGKYDLDESLTEKTLGIVFAGNVPLVGFHDFLCAYLTGWKMQIKLSSKEDKLFVRILELLQEIDPSLRARVTVTDRLAGFDAVIATGSDSAFSYFEYYFRNYPHILRRHRSSVAILTGDETPDALDALADDIFLYFGLGCRNVSKLYVPVGYDVSRLFPYFEKYKWFTTHHRYMNNFEYNLSVLLLNKTHYLTNNFIILTKNENLHSPVAMVYYEHWHDERVLLTKLNALHNRLQCIVSDEKYFNTLNDFLRVKFGQTQRPALHEFADGVDTMLFLLKNKN